MITNTHSLIHIYQKDIFIVKQHCQLPIKE